MDNQSATDKMLDPIHKISAEKSAEAGEPMWNVGGEWVPMPVTLKEMQAYTEEAFDKLPTKRKIKIYQFLSKRKIEKLWSRFCILTFIVAPLLLLISEKYKFAIVFLFYIVAYILYITHKVGYLEGYNKGHIDLRDNDVYHPGGINIKFKKWISKN